MSKLNVKEKMLAVLSKSEGYNTFTVPQAQARFGISNVAARINELRDEGNAIYTNRKTLSNGRKISFYRLGTPPKSMVAEGIKSLRSKGQNMFA